MNREIDHARLPEPVERYFREVAVVQPPADLMGDVLEEIETSARPSRFHLSMLSMAAAVVVVASVGAGVWAISSDGPIGRGFAPGASTSAPAATASPTTANLPTPMAAPSPVVEQLSVVGTIERELLFPPHPLRAVGHGSLWAHADDVGAFVRYDPVTGEEQSRIPVGSGRIAYEDDRRGAILVTDEAVFAAAPHGALVVIDPVTEEVEEFATAAGAAWLAIDGDDLWAVDFHWNEVIRFDLESGEEHARIGTPSGPAHIIIDGTTAWVTTYDGRLVRIDTTTNTIVGEYPIGQGATYAALFADSIYLSGLFAPLERFSIPDERVIARGAALRHAFAHRDRIVGLDRNGYLAFVDPVSLEWTGIIEIGPFYEGFLIPDGDRVWIQTDDRTVRVRSVNLAQLPD